MTSPEHTIDIGVRVNGLDASDDSTLLAYSSEEHGIRVLDTRTWELRGEHLGGVGNLRFLPDRRIAFPAANGGVEIVDSEGIRTQFAGDDQYQVVDAMVIDDREYVVAAGGNVAHLIDARTQSAVQAVGSIMDVLSIAAVPLPIGFAVGSPYGEILLRSGQSILAEIRQGEPVWDLVSLNDPDLLASASANQVVLWNLRTGSREGSLSGHTSTVMKLRTVRVNGKQLLVSGSRGGSVRVWDPVTRQQLRQFLPQTRVRGLASFTGADGRLKLACAGEDGILQIFDMGPQSRTGGVVTRGFGDRVATVDLLGRGTFVTALTDALRPAVEDDGPTVITVEGPWGSGKSTTLELTKNALAEELQDVPEQRKFTVAAADRQLWRSAEQSTPKPPGTKESTPHIPVVVTFNPWRHQSSEQVWAGLAHAVTRAAEGEMLQHVNNRERYWFTRNTKRIDRRHTQRELWKRIRSPFLTVAVLGLGFSVVAQLAKLPIPLPWLVAVPSAPLVVGLLHTAWRYFFARASAFLPGELFAGPVLSNTFASGAKDPVIRDPYYQARSGYLYLVQHDVAELLRDLDKAGFQLVVFVDDLDRCTPRTTAEVFEAINVFLSDTLPRTRFVLGLDPTVVASHVDHAYRELAESKVVSHPDDPSPGWTFLRKLVQLPVRLPLTTEDSVERVLEAQLGPVHRDDDDVVVAKAEPAQATGVAQPPLAVVVSDELFEQIAPPPEVVDEIVVAIERHPKVREELHRRLAAQSDNTVREEKRLLNVWQFYLRVLATADVEQACHLIAVAEIVTRWPAYQHMLRRQWHTLADAVEDDLAWGTAIAKIGFTHADERAAANLRALLRDCDAQAVAKLAERLL